MIGIISAMHEEMQTLLDNLQNKTSTTKGMRTYYKGFLFKQPVVLVFSRWGKVAAATTTTQLINDFAIEEILFTGVAGSIQKSVQIGDIVVGKDLYQYDMDASPLLESFEIPLLKRKYFTTTFYNRKLLLKASQLFIETLSKFILKSEVKKFQINNPKVHSENIASGDQFISTSEQINFVKNNLPNIACVEMEGAAVAQVCHEYKVPFGIFRTISDKADSNSHIDFPKFAKQIASNYALGILKNYFELRRTSKK